MNASTFSAAPETRAFTAPNRAARSLMIGGALWVAHYALEIGMGLPTGQVPTSTPLGLLNGACFSGAIVGICAGLGALAWLMRRSAKSRAVTALSFALIASFSMLFGFILAVTTGKQPGMWGGIGVVGSCLSAIFVALALKRSHAASLGLANALLLIGSLTFPLILLFAVPAGKWIPAFWTDELPFALSGAAYFAFGRALQKRAGIAEAEASAT